MVSMSTTLQQIDFLVGYAEITENNNNNETIFYVEWLDNNSEFPGLTTCSSNKDHGTWELVEVKEDLTLVMDEGDWSKVNAFEEHSYVEVAGKNADELRPLKRAVQPLWPKTGVVNSKERVFNNKENKDDDEYGDHKSQSRVSQRSNRSRKLRELRILDTRYYRECLELPKVNECVPDYLLFDEKEEDILKFCSKGNLAKYKYSYSHGTKNHKKDYSEYSVLESLKKR